MSNVGYSGVNGATNGAGKGDSEASVDVRVVEVWRLWNCVDEVDKADRNVSLPLNEGLALD